MKIRHLTHEKPQHQWSVISPPLLLIPKQIINMMLLQINKHHHKYRTLIRKLVGKNIKHLILYYSSTFYCSWKNINNQACFFGSSNIVNACMKVWLHGFITMLVVKCNKIFKKFIKAAILNDK